jgi:methionyl-tRNA synthetase
MKQKILITSALPYVNNIPHLGNLIGSVLSADAYARFQRINGNEVLFVLGTDEYGTTTETKAREEGITPQELVDKYFAIHKDIYDWFATSYDCLGRSTSEENKKIAQDIFLKLHQKGLIIEKEIEQLYSEKSDTFLSDRFVEGTCPNCGYEKARGDQCDKCSTLIDQKELIDPVSKLDGTKPILKKTKHLYVDLAKMQPKLEQFFNERKDTWSDQAVFITEQWFKRGLQPRAITRDLKWGIPVPLAGWEDKVFYSWFDAPIGYIGITSECLGEKWTNWWKDKNILLYQFMGKDNVPFHSIMFPTYCMGAEDGYHLIDVLDSTAYINYENTKFSKSNNTGVFGDDAKNSGIKSDIWRYYLFRMRPEDNDTEFVWNDFEVKVNNELVGNFGNFVNRVFSLNQKFFEGKKPVKTSSPLKEEAQKLLNEYIKLMEKSRERDALMKANEISSLGNKFLQENEPWTVAKTDLSKAGEIIAECIDLFKLLSCVYHPFVPTASEKIAKMVGYDIKEGFEAAFNPVEDGFLIENIGILFEKLEKTQIEELRNKFGGKK